MAQQPREFDVEYVGKTRDDVMKQYRADMVKWRKEGYRSFSPLPQNPYPFWPLMIACILSIPLLGLPLVLFLIAFRSRPWTGTARFYRR